MTELAIAWRTSWRLWQGYSAANTKTPPYHSDYQSKEEAEDHKREIVRQHGDQAVVCVTPVFVTHAKRSQRSDKRQHNAAACWPFQTKPISSKA